MTQNVDRFSRGVDLTARRSWRAIQKMQIARQLPERPTTGFFRRRSAHHVQIAVQPPSDLSLLRSIANGDRNALGTLFSRHKERVFRFALAIAKDRSLADDVVSDVFLDVARHASSFEGRSQVSTWLLAITRNKALSSLRRNARNRSNEELTESIVDTAQDPEAALQAKQTGKILADCILQLPAIEVDAAAVEGQRQDGSEHQDGDRDQDQGLSPLPPQSPMHQYSVFMVLVTVMTRLLPKNCWASGVRGWNV